MTQPHDARLTFGLAGDGWLRWAAVDVTELLEEVRRRRDLSPVASVALGRALSAATLLQRASTKRAQSLSLDFRGDGPLGRVYAEADEAGNLRGLVAHPQVPTPDLAGDEIPVGEALGEGLLRVRRAEPAREPYESQVRLVTGEIGTDVAHYLEQSEQRHSAVLVGVLLRPDGVAAAGGVLVEALPSAPRDLVEQLERRVVTLPSMSRLLEERGLGGLVVRVLGDLDSEVAEDRELRYRCTCSRERFAARLLSLSAEDLGYLCEGRDLLVAECEYCGEVYRYTTRELRVGSEAGLQAN